MMTASSSFKNAFAGVNHPVQKNASSSSSSRETIPSDELGKNSLKNLILSNVHMNHESFKYFSCEDGARLSFLSKNIRHAVLEHPCSAFKHVQPGYER